MQAKHIPVLVEHWKAQGKNPTTIKNYMSKLRKTAQLLDNSKIIKPDNAAYNIDNRSYAPLHNKAIHHIDLSTCTDAHIRLSLEGQALFGLRREESMKFTLNEALQGNTINIMPSWTKGGIGRVLNISTPAQQEWLNKVALLVQPGESLIPSDRTYRQQLSHYQAQTAQMGLSKLHGLRHAYAQRRYRELTTDFDKQSLGDDKIHLRWADPFLRNILLTGITQDDIESVAKAREDTGVFPTTVNRMLEIIRAIFRKAQSEWGWLHATPPIRMRKIDDRRLRWLTHAESERLLLVKF